MISRAEVEHILEEEKNYPIPPGVAARLAENTKRSPDELAKILGTLREIRRALDSLIEYREAEAIVEYKGKLLHIHVIDGFRPYLKIQEDK